MYVLVLYNLSDIQKGIQALHSVVEYTLIAKKEREETRSLGLQYADWARNHKTVIVLNGGTTGEHGSMQNYERDLQRLGVTFSTFYEPDLNNALTAIAFIVDYKEDTHIVGYLKSMRLA